MTSFSSTSTEMPAPPGIRYGPASQPQAGMAAVVPWATATTPTFLPVGRVKRALSRMLASVRFSSAPATEAGSRVAQSRGVESTSNAETITPSRSRRPR